MKMEDIELSLPHNLILAKAYSPAQNTKNQVQHEETAHHNQRNEEDPVEGTANGIVCLENQT